MLMVRVRVRIISYTLELIHNTRLRSLKRLNVFSFRGLKDLGAYDI